MAVGHSSGLVRVLQPEGVDATEEESASSTSSSYTQSRSRSTSQRGMSSILSSGSSPRHARDGGGTGTLASVAEALRTSRDLIDGSGSTLPGLPTLEDSAAELPDVERPVDGSGGSDGLGVCADALVASRASSISEAILESVEERRRVTLAVNVNDSADSDASTDRMEYWDGAWLNPAIEADVRRVGRKKKMTMCTVICDDFVCFGGKSDGRIYVCDIDALLTEPSMGRVGGGVGDETGIPAVTPRIGGDDERLPVLIGHAKGSTNSVTSLSAMGSFLLSAAIDGMVRLWNMSSLDTVKTYSEPNPTGLLCADFDTNHVVATGCAWR